MVGTRSSNLLIPLAGTLGASNNQETMDFMRSMARSMKVLRKQNEDLNTRLTTIEARSSWKENEREERCKKERQDKVCKGNLIGKGDTERSPSMMNLITITIIRRWKI